MKEYNNLDNLFKNVIKTLYGQESPMEFKKVLSTNIININGENNLKSLNEFDGSTGVYIFLNKNHIPVYIGVAGKQGSTHSLKDRLQKQFNCHESNATLAKNIVDIESLLQNKSIPNSSVKDRKKLISEYAPTLIIIDMGTLNNSNVKNSLALEQILISIFNSKYNK